MRNTITIFIVICLISFANICQAQETKRTNTYSVSVNSKTGEMTMTKEELKNATLGVHKSNSEGSANVSLVGFKLKCPGIKTILVQGDKLSSEAIQGIMGSRIGDYITIYDPTFRIDGKDQSTKNSVSIILKQ